MFVIKNKNNDEQGCQFMEMVGGRGPRLTDLTNLPTPIFFSSDFGHFILKIYKKNKEWKKKKKKIGISRRLTGQLNR